jgi:hypothetical protein
LDKDKDKEDSEYEEGDEDCDDEEKEEERREGEEKDNEEGEEMDNGVEDVTNSEEKTTVQRVVMKEGKYSFIPWIKTNPSPQLAHDQSGNSVVGLHPIVFQNTTHYVPCCTQCGKGFTWSCMQFVPLSIEDINNYSLIAMLWYSSYVMIAQLRNYFVI